MPDPSVEINDTLEAVAELLERVTEDSHCLHCIEVEAELQVAYDEIDALEALLADTAS